MLRIMAQTQIRFDDALFERITTAHEKTGISKNDIIRLTIEAGLKWLEANDYDLTASMDAQPLLDELMEVIEAAAARLLDKGAVQSKALAVVATTQKRSGRK